MTGAYTPLSGHRQHFGVIGLDHNETAPGGASTPNSQGLADADKEHRLMAIMPDRAPTAPESACPICGNAGNGHRRTDDDGIEVATYLCANEHIWMLRWWEAA